MIEKKMSLLIAGLLFAFPLFAQEEAYTAPAEEIAWAKQFSGISGPGESCKRRRPRRLEKRIQWSYVLRR